MRPCRHATGEKASRRFADRVVLESTAGHGSVEGVSNPSAGYGKWVNIYLAGSPRRGKVRPTKCQVTFGRELFAMPNPDCGLYIRGSIPIEA